MDKSKDLHLDEKGEKKLHLKAWYNLYTSLLQLETKWKIDENLLTCKHIEID